MYVVIWNGFDRFNTKLKEETIKTPKNIIKILGKPYVVHIDVMCLPSFGHYNLIKPFLDETRLLRLSNHINYKSIGLVLSEI